MNTSSDWSNYPPLGLPQFIGFETDGCATYGTIDGIESQELFLTGKQNQYSRRWIFKMSGTTQQGNYLENVYAAIAKYGLVLESSYSQAGITSWDEYDAEIPEPLLSQLLAEGQEWLKKWDVSFTTENIPQEQIIQALQNAPLQTEVIDGTFRHIIEQLNLTTCWDSEYHHSGTPIQEFETPLSTFNSIVCYNQIIIKEKKMPQIKSVNIKGEEGIFLAAATPEEFQTLCNVFGKDPNNVDITI